MRNAVIATILLGLVVYTGCGYSLYGKDTADETHRHHNIYVSIIKNDTFEPMLERELTRSLKEEIMQDGRWRLSDPEEAEFALTGTVVHFDLEPLSYDPEERILEYRVNMRVSLTLRNTSTDEVLWKDPDMESFAEYRVTQDITKSKIKKGEAISKACKTLAEDFIIKAVDTPL